jgi:hypothetical protein
LESHAELVDALTAENRVLKERALRFRDMAEMVQRAFVRDDHGAMALFGNNVVAHIAREALLAHAAPQEPTELPLGHAYVWHLPGHPCYRCGQPEVAHAAPSVGDVK